VGPRARRFQKQNNQADLIVAQSYYTTFFGDRQACLANLAHLSVPKMRNGVVFYEDFLSAKGCHIGSPFLGGWRYKVVAVRKVKLRRDKRDERQKKSAARRAGRAADGSGGAAGVNSAFDHPHNNTKPPACQVTMSGESFRADVPRHISNKLDEVVRNVEKRAKGDGTGEPENGAFGEACEYGSNEAEVQTQFLEKNEADGWEGFLEWERASPDTVDFKTIYVPQFRPKLVGIWPQAFYNYGV